MTNTFELFFNDLTPAAQERLMEIAGISSPAEANWDIPSIPLALIDFETDVE